MPHPFAAAACGFTKKKPFESELIPAMELPKQGTTAIIAPTANRKQPLFEKGAVNAL